MCGLSAKHAMYRVFTGRSDSATRAGFITILQAQAVMFYRLMVYEQK
jgi:phosphoenolpyruvate carboxylase